MFLTLLLLVLPAAAGATDCPAHLSAILAQIDAQGLKDARFDCDSLRNAAAVLGVEPDGSGWRYKGERELREGLEKFSSARVPDWLLPIGSVEREAPGGGRALFVFAYDFGTWGRLWPLIALMRDPRAPGDDLLDVLGDGSDYDLVGYYPGGSDGRFAGEGRWAEAAPGATSWDVGSPLVRQARACLPCAGWLCVEAPEACFADLDGDGREELWLAGRGPRAEELRVFQPAEGALATVLSEEDVSGRWEKRGGSWVLVGAPVCGEPPASCPKAELCVRPQVYKFSAGRLEPDAALREVFYPVSVRPAPPGCRVTDSDGALMRAEGRFVRYLPRK